MAPFVVLTALWLGWHSVYAQEIPVLQGNEPAKTWSAAQVAAQIHPGQIVVMGENHGLHSSRAGQMQLLNALRNSGRVVSVGLEFFYTPDQAAVDQYRQGSLREPDFLRQIQWGQPSFEFYRDQARFPDLAAGARTLALNAPRSLTGKIATSGLDSLTVEERALLPPAFSLGRATYKTRFLKEMGAHLPSPEAGDRYFAAMSTWDDTMAWTATEFIKAHPDQVLAIVVGDFHAVYGGGLPNRIEARSGQKPIVFSFVNAAGLSAAELETQLAPSPDYGPRGDFIWLANEPLVSMSLRPSGTVQSPLR
jgi:uncharacterized iron-regulated protein